MRRLERTIAITIIALVFGLAGTVADAKPACAARVSCGATCNGSSAGGFCSGATEPPAYCYQESVESDYGIWVFSCHEGSYDYCCDQDYPY